MSVSADHDQEVARSTAVFPPNCWADSFLTYTPDDMVTHESKLQQIEELKEEVRKELKKASIAAGNSSSELLKLIDSIQLLGVAYHFEKEIEEALRNMYETHVSLQVEDNEEENLESSSLRFRLLRQEGYPVPPSDLFSKFKDEEGNFKESLIGDTPGLLALYEASHLMVDGEHILEEALAFTIAHLQSSASSDHHPNNNDHLSQRVIRALKRPIRKGLTRVEARHYISLYQDDQGLACNESLLKLAKLDFNLLQSLHRKELSEMARWWKDLHFATKLPFARNRLVETYFWALGVYFEPQYFLGVKFLTKITTLLTVTDDIYDAYGTFEELELLTDAIQRWDASCIDTLPGYCLKWYYRALLDVYKEMEEETAKKGQLYIVHYVKELTKLVFQSYFLEVKWLNQRYEPMYDEYISNAMITTCYSILIAISLAGMGDLVTEDVCKWALSRGKMIRASEIICRLMDDLVTHEFEKARMHIPTGIECYIKQHGVTKEEACAELNKQLVQAWKDINHGSLMPTQVPMPFTRLVLNFARVMDVLYKDGDEYTHVGTLMRDLVALVLIDPVPM